MGKLLPSYKKAVIDELVTNISSNTSHYYAFAANPISFTGNTPATSGADLDAVFTNNWQLLFGKLLANTDIVPVIRNTTWTSNTVYPHYDNSVDLTDLDYYVVTTPAVPGGQYDIFKCIDNANGVPSTEIPDQRQMASFEKSDGYVWRYITSVSDANYTKFATSGYVPVIANSTVVAGAYDYSGVEVVEISNAGVGYAAYTSGTVQSVPSANIIQIEASASSDNDFYTRNSIYLYNENAATAQLKCISAYVSNSTGNFVQLTTAANTNNITPSVTQYRISPRVVFTTDGDVDPSAYSVVNATSNSIHSIVLVDTGYGVSWANAEIQSNTSYGSGALLTAIAPPAGGHGSEPVSELDVKGYAVSFSFANTQSSTIPANVLFNKIGLMRNPNALEVDGDKGARFGANTFSAVLKATLSPSATFTVGDMVTGQTSGAVGTVAFANSTTVYLTGDKYFVEDEAILSSDGSTTSTININTLGDIYSKDLKPFYIQNIDNVQRANTQTESFKLIIQV